MIPEQEAYKLIEDNVAILAKSGIRLDVHCLKASVEKKTFTKKDFLAYIEDEISRFLRNWALSCDTRSKYKLENLIVNAKRVGKSFKYIYLKDVEPIKCHTIKSIQQGLESFILTLDNGNLYRMTIPLEDSIFSKALVSFSRIESLPNEYDAEELKNTIRSILTPVLNFEHEDTETTQFMKNEFLKLLPFENHEWIDREDEIEVKNWEYCIINGPWKLTRDRVKIIVNMFVATLNHYSDDPTAPDKWTATVNTAIQSLYNLNNGKY